MVRAVEYVDRRRACGLQLVVQLVMNARKAVFVEMTASDARLVGADRNGDIRGLQATDGFKGARNWPPLVSRLDVVRRVEIDHAVAIQERKADFCAGDGGLQSVQLP